MGTCCMNMNCISGKRGHGEMNLIEIKCLLQAEIYICRCNHKTWNTITDIQHKDSMKTIMRWFLPVNSSSKYGDWWSTYLLHCSVTRWYSGLSGSILNVWASFTWWSKWSRSLNTDTSVCDPLYNSILSRNKAPQQVLPMRAIFSQKWHECTCIIWFQIWLHSK
jgi:hypothetical protein